MPVEAKPLFRPDVLRAHLAAFEMPPVEVDGKFADAVLGRFGGGHDEFIVALEGKGPKDPLDRPFAGRRISAVDQGYRYAINLPCDFILVTNIGETRLYHKGSNQHTFERFDTERLADDEAALKRFVFLLGAERVVPTAGKTHFYALLDESNKVGRELTRAFYVGYADMRQDAYAELARDNPAVAKHDVLASTQKLLDRVLSAIKPYLQREYRAYHGMADLYVYFYELGLRLLRPGGLLSFVVTNKWMKSGYGEPLRRLFGEAAWIESVVDFGHAKQIFEDADVFPSIIVARKPTKAPMQQRMK